MKIFALLLTLMITTSVFPGDKGNGLGGHTMTADSQTLERLLNQSTIVREKTLKDLSDHTKGLKLISERSPVVKDYLNLIADFITYGEMEMLADITFENDDFYHAFNFDELSQEKAELYKMIIWNSLKVEVLSRGNQEGWDLFTSKLDLQRLGYLVK